MRKVERQINRKDLLLLIPVAIVAIMLLLAMYMVDRQWLMMAQMKATMQEQATDLQALRAEIEALDRRISSSTGTVVAAEDERDSQP